MTITGQLPVPAINYVDIFICGHVQKFSQCRQIHLRSLRLPACFFELHYDTLLGYRKGPDGGPEIDPEGIPVVRRIFTRFLMGQSYAPTSRTCSACGLTLDSAIHYKKRIWVCPKCGTAHNKEINAAKNIKAQGLAQYFSMQEREVA